MRIQRWGIAGRAALYCAAIATVLGIAATLVAALQPERPNPIGLARARTAYYQADPRRFDMVFLGDSRTYCGIHSDLIDPLTGRRSINLSAFSHWLPTQYAQLRDIVDDIAPGTVVVLSIGHQNFDASPVPRSYPISLANAARLVALGISPPQLVHNLVWALPTARTLLDRGSLRDRLLARAGLRVNVPSPAIPGQANIAVAADALAERAATLLGEFQGKPGIAQAQVTIDEGHITSVAIIRTGGSYYRVETDPAYFRARQVSPPAADPAKFDWRPDPVRVRIFEAMLDLLHDRGIATIVNEMEEAPYVYSGAAWRAKFRDAMDHQIRPLVAARGFAYTRVDFDRLNNDDYFDYNHLNSQGIERFTPMLAEKLRGLL